MNNVAELRKRFRELGGRVDRRWSEARLVEEIEILEADKRRRVLAEAERRCRELAREQARSAIAARRGAWEVFISSAFAGNHENDDERQLAYTGRQAQRDIDTADRVLSELVENLKGSDPLYALSWSKNAFDFAARRRVGQEFRAMVTTGYTYNEIVKSVTDAVVQGASYPEHSTSPTSNLAEDYLTAAWASLLSNLLDC